MTGNIFSVASLDGVDGFYDTNHDLGFVKVKDIFQMDISSIPLNAVTCGRDPLPFPVITGTFSLTPFDIPQLHLFFEHNGAVQYFSSLSTLPDTWPPTDPNVPVTVTDKDGQWEVWSKGQNHQYACTGEGGLGNNPIAWTATVTLLP